jgi:hypothetical protein
VHWKAGSKKEEEQQTRTHTQTLTTTLRVTELITPTATVIFMSSRRPKAFDKAWLKILQTHLGAWKHAEFGLQVKQGGHTEVCKRVSVGAVVCIFALHEFFGMAGERIMELKKLSSCHCFFLCFSFRFPSFRALPTALIKHASAIGHRVIAVCQFARLGSDYPTMRCPPLPGNVGAPAAIARNRRVCHRYFHPIRWH